MENQNNTGKNVLIGCCSAAALVAVLLVVGGVVWGKKGWEKFQELSAEQAIFNELEADWIGRWSGEPDGSKLIPTKFGDFELKSQDRSADVPNLKISGIEGWHGNYQNSAGESMDLMIYAVSDLEAEALKSRAKNAVDTTGNYRLTFDMNNRFTYRFGPPDRSGVLWYVPGSNRMILLQCDKKREDLGDVLQEYLRATTVSP